MPVLRWGSNDKKYYPYDGYQCESAVYRVYCQNCTANIEGHYLEGLIKHWNRRVDDGREEKG